MTNKAFAALLVALFSVSPNAPAQTKLESLTRYEFGRTRDAWNELDAQLRNPLQREREAAERLLIKVLVAQSCTTDARILACRGLRYVAGPDGIQSLLSLVRDQRLSQEACLALQEKDSPDIDVVLREALPIVEKSLKPQIMITLGRRGDREAVPALAAILKGFDDPMLKITAMRALGNIGGAAALKALSSAKLANTLEDERNQALLAGAVRSLDLKTDDRLAGLAALRRLAINPALGQARLGAVYEWARADPTQRDVLCRQAFKSRNDGLLEVAPKLFALLDVKEKRDLYGEFYGELTLSGQTLLLELWELDYQNEEKIREVSLNIELPESLRKAASHALDRVKH